MQADYYLLKTTRFYLGMTQAEAAKAAGIALTTYIKAEQGQSITASTNGKIKKALGLL